MEAAAEEVAAWENQAAASAWAGVGEAKFGAVAAPLGGPQMWRDLALFPPAVLRVAL